MSILGFLGDLAGSARGQASLAEMTAKSIAKDAPIALPGKNSFSRGSTYLEGLRRGRAGITPPTGPGGLVANRHFPPASLHIGPSAGRRLNYIEDVVPTIPFRSMPAPEFKQINSASSIYQSPAKQYLTGLNRGRVHGPAGRRASIIDAVDTERRNPPPFRHKMPGYVSGDLEEAMGLPRPTPAPVRQGTVELANPVAVVKTTQIPRPKALGSGPLHPDDVVNPPHTGMPMPPGAGRRSPRVKNVGRRRTKPRKIPRKKGPVLSATGGAPTSGRSSGAASQSLWGQYGPGSTPTRKHVPGRPPPPKGGWPGPKGRKKQPRYARKQAARLAGLPAPPAGARGYPSPPLIVRQPIPSGAPAMAGVKRKRGTLGVGAQYNRYKVGVNAANQMMSSSVVRGPNGRRAVPTKRGMRHTLPTQQSWARRNRNALGVLGAGTLGASVLAGNAYQGRSRRHPTTRTPQIPGGMPAAMPY